MDLTFERGDPQRPKGHALVYFRVNTEPDKVYATYIITLPVIADLTKYVPPFLASHLGSVPLSDFSALRIRESSSASTKACSGFGAARNGAEFPF